MRTRGGLNPFWRPPIWFSPASGQRGGAVLRYRKMTAHAARWNFGNREHCNAIDAAVRQIDQSNRDKPLSDLCVTCSGGK